MLLQERQPDLHGLWVSVTDLNQPAQCNTLKVLLRLLENEARLGHRPALSDARQRHGAERRQAEVVGGAQGKIGKEFETALAVGAQLQVGSGHAELALAAERSKVERLDGAGDAWVVGRIGIIGRRRQSVKVKKGLSV